MTGGSPGQIGRDDPKGLRREVRRRRPGQRRGHPAGFGGETGYLEPGRPEAELLSREIGPGDIGVLVRTNRQATVVQAALRSVGVPVVVAGAVSVFATRRPVTGSGFWRLSSSRLRVRLPSPRP